MSDVHPHTVSSRRTDEQTVTEWSTSESNRIDTLLTALTDPDARTILQETGDGPRSAREISERCEIPSSTAYRKIDALVDAGLLVEEPDVLSPDDHIKRYGLRFESIDVTVRDEELEVQIHERD